VSALLLAFEGIDGSGKGTQAGMLRDALTREGKSCGLIAFPRYEATHFGRTIARYLNGEFGDLKTAGAHFAALLYAGDRLESLAFIEAERAARDVLIFDRYVESNLAHQAAKLPTDQRGQFIDWLEAIEFCVYRLPQPHLVIYLDQPVSVAQQLIGRKAARTYTAKAADLHEADTNYLTRTAEVYGQLARRSGNWQIVSGCVGHQLRSPADVHEEILQHVRSRLLK